MRADAHAHLFRRGFSGDAPEGTDFSHYSRLRQQHDINEVLVVGYEGDPKFAGNNADLLVLADTYDWVKPTLFLDPVHPPAAAAIADNLARGAVGFSLYFGDDRALADALPDATWTALSEQQALVSINATPHTFPVLSRVLRLAPGAQILISHLGLPGPARGQSVAERRAAVLPLLSLANIPNVSVKFSGLYAIDDRYPHTRADEATNAILETYGPGRMAWGSDFSPALGSVSEAELFDVPAWFVEQLSPEESELVTGGTLRRILAEAQR